MVQLLFFGRLGELAGDDARVLQISSPMTIATLIAQLGDSDPALAKELAGERVRAAVNGTLVDRSHLVTGGDEIAFLPPVSGG